MKPEECVLYSGAASGAEEAFGAAAERRGIDEVNFTFEGHNDARRRGIRVLTHEELTQGDVSLAYVSKLMNRRYRDTPLFKKVLQSIWHQVNSGQEIYVVGKILDDDTVKGGTGWSVELARMWSRDLWVFDQEREAWHQWDDGTWVAGTPVIRSLHLTGTGTRMLQPAGKAAIEDLFRRSFASDA